MRLFVTALPASLQLLFLVVFLGYYGIFSFVRHTSISVAAPYVLSPSQFGIRYIRGNDNRQMISSLSCLAQQPCAVDSSMHSVYDELALHLANKASEYRDNSSSGAADEGKNARRQYWVGIAGGPGTVEIRAITCAICRISIDPTCCAMIR